MTSFDILEGKASLVDLSANEALLSLSKPTLIHLKGQDSTVAVLISVLLHGCEPCGFHAMLKEFNTHKEQYPIDVYFLVGNVESAQIPPYFTNRLVPGKENYNRIWVQGPPDTEGEKIAHDIFEYLATLPIKAHLDIHSFTAKDTPPHAMVVTLQGAEYAKHFVDKVFLLEAPIGAMMEKTKLLGPGCVVECGTNNSNAADEFAYEALQKFFVLNNIKPGKIKKIGKDVFNKMANIKIAPDATVVWQDTESSKTELTLRPDVCTLNLKEIPEGEFLGWADALNVFIVKINGNEVDPSEVFRLDEGKLYTKYACVPNFMAANEKISKESGFYFFQKMKEA